MIRLRTIRLLFTPWVKRILWLDLIGLALVAAMWLVGGGERGGLAPYYGAVARAALSPKTLLLYIGAITTYSVILEFCLRRLLQESIHTARAPWLRPLARPIAAFCYGVTHLLYHPLGMIYAMLLGFASADAYSKERDWKILALWHAQWNMLAVAGALFLAMLGPGDARDQLLYEYKKSRIEEGALSYVEGWGWRDRYHNHDGYYEKAHHWAKDGARGDVLTLRATVKSPTGWDTPVKRTYVLTSLPKTPMQRWATACTVVLDFAKTYEHAQEDAFFWTGATISAWQFDDLPSTVLTCIEVAEFNGTSEPRRVETFDRAALLERWEREGVEAVRRQERDFTPPRSATTLTGREKNLIKLFPFGRQFWDTEAL